MSRLQTLAAQALAQRLETEQAALLGNTHVLQQLPDRLKSYPALVIMPESFKILTWYEDEVIDDAGNPIVINTTNAMMDVGTLSGTMRLWVADRYPVGREDLEDAILRSFMADSTGTIEVTLTNVVIDGFPTGFDATVAFSLTDADWHEEMVFSEKRWEFIGVDVDIPIFILRANAALVDDMQLCFSTDLATDISAATTAAEVEALLEPDFAQFTVNDDGSLTPIP